MADYHSPTVVTPELPVGDVTLLERMILGRVFFAPGQHDGLLHFAAPLIPEEFFSVSAGTCGQCFRKRPAPAAASRTSSESCWLRTIPSRKRRARKTSMST